MPGHRIILRPMSKPGGALPARYTHFFICACPFSIAAGSVGEVGCYGTLGVKSPGYPQGGFCGNAGRREKVPLGYPGACSVIVP